MKNFIFIESLNYTYQEFYLSISDYFSSLDLKVNPNFKDLILEFELVNLCPEELKFTFGKEDKEIFKYRKST